MLWQLDVGDSASVILQRSARTGHAPPEKFLNPPELNPYLQFYYDAFFDLTFDRPIGFGPGPIPFMTIVAYCKHYGYDQETTDDLVTYVRVLDIAYLEHVGKKTKNDGKKNS